MVGTSSRKIAVIAALSTVIPNSALPQQQGGAVATPAAQTPTTSTPGTVQGTTATTTTGAVAPVPTLASGGTIPASGQPLPNTGGLQIDFGLSSKLSYDDNFKLSNNSGGGSVISDSLLSFNLSKITPNDNLSLQGSSTLRFADIPGRTVTGFEDPQIRFNYARDGLNSRFTADARYRHADREFLDPFQVEQEEQALGQLIGGGGVVTWNTYGLGYVTGINSPLGFQFSAQHDERTYDALAQSVNPLLFDRYTDTATATVTARVSQSVQLRGSVGVTEYNANDTISTDRQTLDYAVGGVFDINPILQLDAQIGYTDVTTDTNLGRSTRSGLTNAVRLTKTLTNGTVFGDLNSTVNQNGTRTSLSFGRDLLLPNGSFVGVAGVTHTPGGSNRLTGSLSYSHDLRSSSITVSGARSVSTNGLNQDILNTRLSLAYAYAINNNSAVNLSVNWGRSEGADSSSGINTTNRTTIRAAYSYALTQDWNVNGGVQIRHRNDNTGDAQSNSVFVTLDRNFSFRP